MEPNNMEKNKPNRFILTIVIIVAVLALVILYAVDKKGVGDDMQIDTTAAQATSTASTTTGTGTAHTTASTTPGSNDMNGSGQNEPSYPVKSTGLQSPVVIPLYQGHIVGGSRVADQVLIYPWAVLEDSRCPANVNCVWAGRIKVALRLQNPETKKELVAGTVLELGQSVKVNGLELTLLEVQPNQISGTKIKDGEYRFIFDVKQI